MVKAFLRFWSEERSLSALLIILAVQFFMPAFVTIDDVALRLAVDLAFALILLAGLNSIARRRSERAFFPLFVVLSVSADVARVVTSDLTRLPFILIDIEEVDGTER